MGDVVNLRSTPIDLLSDMGRQFVVDCTRAGEGLISDRELAEKYELSPADWQAIVKDSAVGRAIRAEREKRVNSGVAVREAAARHLIKGPGILNQLMTGDSTAKTKLEAFKELRTTASVGSSTDRTADTERFIIRIDLTSGGGEVTTYNKSIKPDASDGDGPSGDDPTDLIPSGEGPYGYG